MATAYAAVVSLVHLIDEQVPIYVARRPTIFSEKLLGEIKSLKEKLCCIQDYLEVSLSLRDRGSKEAQDLRRRIIDASYAATYVIESHIVNDIIMDQENAETVFQSCADAVMLHVSEVIEKVIQDMDSITSKMMEIEDLKPNNLTPLHPLGPNPTTIDHDDIMVGFDDNLKHIVDKLIGEQSTLQIIPITGMGGIGKTTLAQNLYGNSLIKQRFDIRGWVTVSQVYNIEQILLSLLHGVGVPNLENLKNNEYHHLGQILRKHLFGRRYLIIVDDLWNTEAWDKINVFLPDTKGSQIIVTTRLKEVANYVGSSNLHEINLLDENKSWSLLCRKAFGQEGCPHPELEVVGKKIANSCQGLPLSIVVIGGLLAKSKMTLDSWKYVADNINEIMSSKGSDCLDIFLLSYTHLPIHLQPCFLYMSVFPEDHTIRVSELINLWVAEGFLKPRKLKTLEEVAEEYLKDLTERHLIMVNEWESLGKMKTCSIHDLLRDLCLREAQKEKFILVNKVHKLKDSSQFIIEHRIAIECDKYDRGPFRHVFQSKFLVRSMTCKYPLELRHVLDFKLLRAFNVYRNEEVDINLLNLRFLCLSGKFLESFYLVHRLWNLQTLLISSWDINGLLELQIWKMPHLRHLICIGRSFICIPDPRRGLIDGSVLENLQTLSGIKDFSFTEEVVRRVPYVKELVLIYCPSSNEMVSNYYLNNIGLLHALQSLTLKLSYGCFGFNGKDFIENCVFLHSLKELALNASNSYDLEDIITRIGCLPLLEKLKLEEVCTKGEWNPVEGQFLELKVLKLRNLYNLVDWNADSDHFPLLEHLNIKGTYDLKEIPSGFGEIPTLQSITLKYASAPVVNSAKDIWKEQHSFGNEGFRLILNTFNGRIEY